MVPSSESRPARPLRADAVRNRAAILDAARRQITEHGLDVGMDEIATAAGVAVGTLYRHFPTKTDLVAAAVSSYVDHVAARAEVAAGRVVDGASAFAELTGLLREIVVATATNQAVKAAAVSLDADVEDSDGVRRAHEALQTVIQAARAEGSVRDDLRLEDLYLLLSNAPDDQPVPMLHRWVELMIHGITGASSTSGAVTPP